MAGLYNRSTSASDFLTPFTLFRTVDADDADPAAITDILDLTKSSSARHNTLMLLATEGSNFVDPINIALYANFPDAPAALALNWYTYHAADVIIPGLVYIFDNLIACRYKLFVTRDNIAGVYSIYASTNVNTALRNR